MTLLNPKTYRFTEQQDAWLLKRAKELGHTSKTLVLRMLINQAMKKGGH